MGVEKDFDTLDTSEQLDSTGGTLEEYGVWVKSGPEDIDETTNTDSFSLENLPEIEETTSFLTEEEESLLKDLETITPGEEDNSVQEDQIPELTQFGEDDSIEEDFNLEDLDDLSDFDSIEEEDSVDEATPEHDLSLDEDIFTIDTPEDASFDEDMEAETPGNEEDSLFEPEDESADMEDEVSVENPESEKDFFDLDLDSLEEVSEESGQEGFPSFNEDDFDSISLDEDSTLAVSGISESSESVFSDIPEEFNLDDLEQDEEEVLPELSVEDLEEDTEETNPSPDIEAEIEEKSEVLKKIEEELHSIRDELASLKSELSNLKLSPSAAGREESGVDDNNDLEPLTSFFEEDEDETIALTGDELDNILNTADVTEEAGKASEGPEEELDIDLSSMESSLAEGLELPPAAEIQPPAEDIEDIQEEPEIEELDLSSLENTETEQEEEIELAEPGNADLELSDLESEEEFDLSDIGIPEEESAEEISFSEPETDEEEFSAPESETEEVLDITEMEDLEELEEESSSEAENIPEIDSVEEEELELLDNPEEHLVSDALLDGEDILDIDDEELYPGIESSEEPESFEEIEALGMEDLTDETPEEPESFEEIEALGMEDLTDETPEEPANTENEETLNIESENEETFEEPDFSELEIEDLELEAEESEEPEEVILEAETEEEPGELQDELQDLEEEIELDISPEDSQEMNEIVENSEEEAEFPENEILELNDDGIAYEPVELDSDLEELEEIETNPETSTVEADGSLTAEDYSEAVQNDETNSAQGLNLNPELQGEIKSVLSYMDQLLEALPEEKIEEFARSEHFKVYQKLFDELGISS